MITVALEYYNDDEEKLFKAYPNFSKINALVGKEISISKSEFLAYMMFTEQKDSNGFRTYNDLESRVSSRLGDIEDYLDFSGDSVTSNFSSTEMKDAGLTERIGVGLGLSTINQFHGLTEADWTITDDVYVNGKRVKDFDFEIPMASDKERIIQVENKGNVCDNNLKKNDSVYKHYKSIKKKKEKLLELEKDAGIPKSQNLHYGTIGVLDNKNKAKVYLVDPPAFDIGWSPLKFKLITRLTFYLKVFKEIGVHNRIINPLVQRIDLLKEVDDISKFNNNRLDIGKNPQTYIQYNKNLVKLNTNEAVGTFFNIDTKNGVMVFFVALTNAIIKRVINQDFEEIINYEYKNADLLTKAIIELSIKISKSSDVFEKANLKFIVNEKKKRYLAQYYMPVEFTSSGRIFGVINQQYN